MFDPVIKLESYDDLEGVEDLGDRDRDAIAALANDGRITLPFGAVWLPEWLADQKDLVAVEGVYRVFRGHLTEETDKAIRVYQDNGREWVPKSQAHFFAAPEGVTIETPTRTLDSFGGDA